MDPVLDLMPMINLPIDWHEIINDYGSQFKKRCFAYGVCMKSPDLSQNLSQEGRRRSFTEWPRLLLPLVENMVMSGFYYTEVGDCVQCICCGVVLKDWTPFCDPWEEHAKWTLNCKFLLLNKGNDFVKDAISWEPITNCTRRAIFYGDPTSLDPVRYEILEKHVTPNLIPSFETALHLDFEGHRIFTFPIIGTGLKQLTVELAKSGFYHTRLGTVQCRFCKLHMQGGLDELTTNVHEIHREMSPNCPLILGCAHLNVPIKDPKNYRFEANRLLSLLMMNDVTGLVNHHELSKAGFYWTGSGTMVRCNFCRVEIDGAYSKVLPHVCATCHRSAVMGIRRGNVSLGCEKTHPVSFYSTNPFLIGEAAKRDAVVRVFTPEFSNNNDRLKTLQEHACNPMKNEDLANAGFVHSGVGDLMYCFSCSGDLKGWGPDHDPWTEHAAWYPHCRYIRMHT